MLVLCPFPIPNVGNGSLVVKRYRTVFEG